MNAIALEADDQATRPDAARAALLDRMRQAALAQGNAFAAACGVGAAELWELAACLSGPLKQELAAGDDVLATTAEHATPFDILLKLHRQADRYVQAMTRLAPPAELRPAPQLPLSEGDPAAESEDLSV